jgi:hypothetical protein
VLCVSFAFSFLRGEFLYKFKNPEICFMKKWVLVTTIGFMLSLLPAQPAVAQCSICTKTAQQLGEKPAKGMNMGILYLAFAPFAIVGFVAYRWWKNHKNIEQA